MPNKKPKPAPDLAFAFAIGFAGRVKQQRVEALAVVFLCLLGWGCWGGFCQPVYKSQCHACGFSHS